MNSQLPATIQPISESSRRRIVAGQAVFDLASAVKELVDNSLDANSKSINIRLFNQGLDIVEVSDDGCGVPIESRHLLATPHATSKIRSFEDIYRTNTISTSDSSGSATMRNSSSSPCTSLGFRGEALFCLANLSANLVIATRTADEDLAQRMEFRRDGSLRLETVTRVPKKVGTTVAVVRLLEAVPVRRYDLKRRMGEQRRKLVHLIAGYAVFAPHVRFQLIDITTTATATPNSTIAKSAGGRGATSSSSHPREQILLATPGQGHRLPDTISTIYGSAFWGSLTEFRVDLTNLIASPVDDNLRGDDNHEEEDGDLDSQEQTKPESQSAAALPSCLPSSITCWEVRGYISRFPSSSRGESSAHSTTNKGRFRDEQLYAINHRPVDMPRFTRMFSDVWRSLGGPAQSRSQQHPSCILEFSLPNNAYDVNVSPDKREVILPQESELLDLLQHHVLQLWSSQIDGQFQSAPSLELNKRQRSTPSFDEDEDANKTSSNANISPSDANNTAAASNKFNRRYAFSHDVSKIRLQHEYDDGRTRSCDENWDATLTARRASMSSTSSQESSGEKPIKSESPESSQPATTEQEADNENNVGIETQTKLCANKQPPTAQVTPMGERTKAKVNEDDNYLEVDQERPLPEKRRFGAAAASSAGRYDPADDLIWRAAKRRFHETSVAQTRLATEEQFASSFAQFRAAPSTAGMRGGRTRTPSTVISSSSQNNSTLERFGFRTQTSFESSVVRRSGSGNSQQPERVSNHDHTDNGPFKRVSFDSAPTLESEEARPDSPHGDDQQPMDVLTLDTEKVSPLSSTNRSLLQPEEQEDPPDSGSAVGHQQLTKGRESEREDPDSPIVWENFSDTSAVLAAARKERINMQDRRISLQSTDADGGEDLPGVVENGGNISLQKEDFKKMVVVGQFNMGFILAKSADNHLWIMDQHACDEKYNFEKLVAETVIHEQPLIAPMPLELSIAEECCVLDNMEIFEKNGFRFQYNDEKPPRFRLSLTAIPHSGARDGRKAVQFGKEDVAALCGILGTGDDTGSSYAVASGGTGADGSGMYGNNAVRRYSRGRSDDADRVIARLPKAIAMFASRACRGSIMIGKALSAKEMERVVKHLATIDHPWNCPHGRPTMRHAADLRQLVAEDERNVAARLAGPTVTIMSQEMEVDDDVGLTQEH
ncbi:hypothetical protein ACA910_015119 [Epithemia clementina (nom. ined.)]